MGTMMKEYFAVGSETIATTIPRLKLPYYSNNKPITEKTLIDSFNNSNQIKLFKTQEEAESYLDHFIEPLPMPFSTSKHCIQPIFKVKINSNCKKAFKENVAFSPEDLKLLSGKLPKLALKFSHDGHDSERLPKNTDYIVLNMPSSNNVIYNDPQQVKNRSLQADLMKATFIAILATLVTYLLTGRKAKAALIGVLTFILTMATLCEWGMYRKERPQGLITDFFKQAGPLRRIINAVKIHNATPSLPSEPINVSSPHYDHRRSRIRDFMRDKEPVKFTSNIGFKNK